MKEWSGENGRKKRGRIVKREEGKWKDGREKVGGRIERRDRKDERKK